MSNYVFLDSVPFARMPSGQNNEWRAFWANGTIELEAKNGLPLLWCCLFGQADLQWAKPIDDFDVDDPEGEREELENSEESSDDARYPYLVADKEQAIQRLERRREKIVAAIGEPYRPVYDAFMRLVNDKYGPFVLVRTSGLPDACDAGPWMNELFVDVDRLDESQPLSQGPVQAMVDDFQKWQAKDPIWLLSGSGGGAWPTPELAQAFPNGRKLMQAAAPGAATEAATQPVRHAKKSNPVMEWIAPLFVGGCTVVVYLKTSSYVLGLLTFVVTTAISVWLLMKLSKRIPKS